MYFILSVFQFYDCVEMASPIQTPASASPVLCAYNMQNVKCFHILLAPKESLELNFAVSKYSTRLAARSNGLLHFSLRLLFLQSY